MAFEMFSRDSSESKSRFGEIRRRKEEEKEEETDRQRCKEEMNNNFRLISVFVFA
jgi:hypothetical protein